MHKQSVAVPFLLLSQNTAPESDLWASLFVLMFPEGDSIVAGSHNSKGPEQEGERSHQDSEGELEVRPGSCCPVTYFLQRGRSISPNSFTNEGAKCPNT